MHTRLHSLGAVWRHIGTHCPGRDTPWRQVFQLALLVTVLAGLGWSYTLGLIADHGTSELARAKTEISNLGRAGLEHTERSIRSVDQLLKVARTQYLKHGARLDLRTLTLQAQGDASFIRDVRIADAQGILVYGSLPLRWRQDVSNQPFFAEQKASTTDALYVAAPRREDAAADASIQVSRRITLPDGRFAGVLVASVDPHYFTRFYADLVLGPDAVVSLLKDDGTILARRVNGRDEFGGHLGATELTRRLAQGDTTGTQVFPYPSDGVERMVHFRRLPAVGLVLTIGQSTSVLLAPHWKVRQVLLLQAALANALLLVAVGLLAWHGGVTRRHAQLHLKQLQDLTALTNRTPGMVYQYLQDAAGSGHFVVVSEGAQALLQVSPQALMADAGLALAPVHPDDLPGLHASIQHSARSLQPWRHEWRMCFTGQGTCWLAGDALPQRLADGSVRWDGFMSDITRHKEIEATAHSANLAKSDFLSRMSHEIRSPLNAILGLAYLLEQAALDADSHSMVGKIRASGRMLLGLISDILDVSKIEAGQMVIEKAPFRLSGVIDSVAEVLTLAAVDKHIALQIHPPPPGIYTLMGDVLRLEQVLLNLCTNAIKFTPRGRVELRCELISSTSRAVVLRFSVRDTGIGIAADMQHTVFEAFTQAEGSTGRRFGGSGLGLTICRELVELMGGEIGVNSVPQEGSEFWFTLPLERVADLPIRSSGPESLKVWLADDSDIALQYASQVCNGLGWQVRSFDSGAAVLNLLVGREHRALPDVIVMDWKMPGMDGLAAVRAIRERLPPAHCPLLIVMSNLSLTSLVRNAGVDKVDALLEKPVTASSLHHAVLEARRKRAASQSPSPAATSTRVRALQGTRVLVVDDSDINREVARRILHGQGAIVSMANNGREAIDWLLAYVGQVDLVLMDVQMPVMDGMEATRRLRRMPEFARLPIVALTAGAFKAQQDAARDAGMTHFVSKPFDVPSTIALIQRLTGRPGSGGSQPAAVPGGGVDAAVMDLAKALEMWGDMDSYRDYLQRFMQTYRDAAAGIREDLRTAQRPAALALTHKLVGVAANMALPQVFYCDAELEQVLDAGHDPLPQLAQLEAALLLACEAIAQQAATEESIYPC